MTASGRASLPGFDAWRVAPDGQALTACKRLLRMIRQQGLVEGDALPPHAQLRRQLGVGNATLMAGMRLLVSAGVLSRRRRAGTVVRSLTAMPAGVWSVGVAGFYVQGQGGSSFFAELNNRLFGHLADAGCRVHGFIRGDPADALPPDLPDFPDVQAAMASGLLDAVVTPACVELSVGYPVPVVHVGSEEPAPVAVLIDQFDMTRRAVAMLAEAGCRRSAVVSVTSPLDSDAVCVRFWQGFQAGLAAAGLAAAAGESQAAGVGAAGGRRVAEALLARPRRERPDGLIILDDWIAVGLIARLTEAGRWRPRLMVQTNRQTPFAYPLPVERFEVDIDELARRAVALTLDRMLSGSTAPHREWVQPRLATHQPFPQPVLQLSVA